MSKKRKVGIIGCGKIFNRHVEAIETNSNDFELVAICDIDQNKISKYSTEHKVPGFLNYLEMLKKMKGKMNFVVIATPNSLHYPQAMNSLKHGYNILIEKPINFSHKKILAIAKYAKKLEGEAYAVLQVRYNPTVDLVKKALDKKLLGEIHSISFVQRWQRPLEYFSDWRGDINIGGRTLYEVGIHYLDILQLLFGIPKVLYTSTFQHKHKKVGIEDTILSVVQFGNKASGTIEVTIASEPRNLECSISIMGSRGFLKIGGAALDKIETAFFDNKSNETLWNKIQSNSSSSVKPNSYGTHVGSCPNHPKLYGEIAKGKGIKVEDAANSVKFIENLYLKEK